MGAIVTLTSSALTGSPVRILCSGVTVAIKKNNTVKPIENGTDIAEVQTQSFNNITYSIQGLMLADALSSAEKLKIEPTKTLMTYNNLLELMALAYDGTNAPTLTITYGRNSTTSTLPQWDKTAGPISVVLDQANVNIDTKDSVEAYFPTGSITFVETR